MNSGSKGGLASHGIKWYRGLDFVARDLKDFAVGFERFNCIF